MVSREVSEVREAPKSPGWAWWTGMLWSFSASSLADALVLRHSFEFECDWLLGVFCAAYAMHRTVAHLRYELWRAKQ